MTTYKANQDTWLSHENRKVLAGETFNTTFPKVKIDGKEVEMRLGENLELVEEAEAKPKGKGPGKTDGADLA